MIMLDNNAHEIFDEAKLEFYDFPREKYDFRYSKMETKLLTNIK